MVELVEDWINLALKSKDLQKKLEYCTKYLELNPNDSDVWHYKGTILNDLERHGEAVDCYENAYIGADINYILGSFFVGTDNVKAIELLSKVAEKNPRALIEKGIAFCRLTRPEDAIACCDKALEANISKLCNIEALFWKGLAFTSLRSFEEAIKCFDNLVDIDPGDYGAWHMKGLILLYDLERYEEAIECFNEALKIHPRPSKSRDAPIVEPLEDLKRLAEKRLREEKEEELRSNRKHQRKKGFFKKLFS